MGEYDDRRVEPRTVLVGMGMGVTPERISELEERQQELEKLSRPKPNESFDKVMARRQGATAKPARARKEEKRDTLPPTAVTARIRTWFSKDDVAGSGVIRADLMGHKAGYKARRAGSRE